MDQTATSIQRVLAAANVAKGWMESPAGLRIKTLASYGISALILLLLARSIAQIGWREVLGVLPASPIYWILFAGAYLLQPWTEWWIYRRWWKLDWRALPVFVKMRVMNEALFSYSGHTYLLIWAAERLGITFDPDKPPPRLMGRGGSPGVDPGASPFAAVKDMAITSGLAGNLATLVMVLVAVGVGSDAIVEAEIEPATVRLILWSFGLLIGLNLVIVVFRHRVMSLPVGANLFSFRWHLFRVLASQAMIVGSWLLALPLIPVETWLLLGALRMMIGRMPLPNKELLFAAIAVGLTGDASVQVAALMAAQGAFHLIFHGLSWSGAVATELTVDRNGPSRSF